MKQDLNNTDLNVPVALSIQNHKKYESLKIQKNAICADNNQNQGEDDDQERLQNLVAQLELLVDAQRTRVDLLDDEAAHFKESYENINTEYFRIKK